MVHHRLLGDEQVVLLGQVRHKQVRLSPDDFLQAYIRVELLTTQLKSFLFGKCCALRRTTLKGGKFWIQQELLKKTSVRC